MSQLYELTNRYLEALTKDYDLDDLASNDELLLNQLATALAQLDVYNEALAVYLEDTDNVDAAKVEKLQKVITAARSDASKIQDDLKISRKARKEKTASITEYISDLKIRAKHFLEQRLSYIYCPHCGTLVATLWLLDYTKGSRCNFVCPHCDRAFLVSDQDLFINHTNDNDKLVPTR